MSVFVKLYCLNFLELGKKKSTVLNYQTKKRDSEWFKKNLRASKKASEIKSTKAICRGFFFLNKVVFV